MPIAFRASDDLEEIELVLTGRLTSEEYLEFFRGALAQQPAPLRMRATLIDCLGGDVAGLSLDAVREVAHLTDDDARRAPGARCTAMVTRDPLTFGLARQWDLLSAEAGHRFQIFARREDATAWLALQRRLAGCHADARPASVENG